LEAFTKFLHTATDVYDDFTKAAAQIPSAQYLNHAAAELPPDLILDLRGASPHTSKGLLSLLGRPGDKRAKTLSPTTLVEAVSNPKQKPLAVSVTFSIQPLRMSRYMTLPVLLLKSGITELWLLANSSLFSELEKSPSLRLELMLPSTLLRRATDILASCGFPPASNLPRAKYLQMFGAAVPTELRAALRHRDVHAGNILSTPTQLRLVDLGDVDDDLVAVDVSRLEVSLMRKLIDRLGMSLAETHTVIGALSESSEAPADRRLLRVQQVISALRGAAKHIQRKHPISDSQIALARVLQSLYFSRYLVAEVLGTTAVSRRDSFAAYCGSLLHDFEQCTRELATSEDTQTLKPAEQPALGRQFGELWSRALTSPSGFLLPKAEAVLKAIQRAVGAAWSGALTDLELEVLSATPGSASDAFTSPKHVLLYGPTSCGKTTVADTLLVRTALLNTERPLGLYVAPTRALAQEKYYELSAKLAGTPLARGLVLSTGENTEQDHRILTGRFTIAIMVYEKANILFSRNRRALERMGCVVVDELHMLEDLERGPILEMALTKMQDNRRRMDRRVGEHLRIVAISTEGADPGALSAFLGVVDPDTLFPEPPIVCRGRKRPVPIEHRLVLPGDGPKTFTDPLVTIITSDSDRILSEAAKLDIAKTIRPVEDQLASSKNAPSKTELQERLFALLDSRITKLRHKGYRAVVFIPSKTELESLAETYRGRRHAKEDMLSVGIVEGLKRAAKSAGEMDTGHRVYLAAAKGLFIHHSEVESAARRLIEELLSQPLQGGRTQIVFATETLSYGVNLAVTDVVLYGTRFYATSRRRILLQLPVSVCAFHNMTGRAGRLGRSVVGDASAFVLVTQEINPFHEIVEKYYSDMPVLSSVLVDREDKAVLRDQFERESFGLKADISYAQAFSYPFVRSVLDALRHLSVINSSSRAFYAAVPLVDLQAFLFRTLYAQQRVSQPGDIGHRERELFTKAIDCTLEDLARPPLNLVERELKDGHDVLSITVRGEAIIDTGTEINTLRPFLELGQKLQGRWKDAADDKSFPMALYLLAVVALAEVYRHVIRCAPEVSDADMMRAAPEDSMMNRLLVLERFAHALSGLGVVLPVALTPNSLRDVLDDHFKSFADNDFHGKYDGGMTDAVLRLFTALATWSRGSARSAVRELILGAPGEPLRSNQLSGFGGFRDQSSWKLVFLARILTSPDSQSGAILNTRDERELYALALSVRIGCELRACRLIFRDYPESLSREEATSLVAQAYSADRLVQEPSLISPDWMPPDRFAALRLRLCQETIDRYSTLRSTWTAALGAEPPEAELATLWDESADAFEAAVQAYYGTKIGAADAERVVATQATWPPIVEGERKRVLEPGLADRTILRFASGYDDTTVRWTLEVSVNAIQTPAANLAVRGFQFLRDWSLLTHRGGLNFSSLLPEPEDEFVVVAVVFPWLPPLASMPTGLRDDLMVRAGRGQRVLFVSAAAFMLLLSGVVRGFLSSKDLFEFYESGAPLTTDGFCVIGFEHAEEFLLTKGSPGSMPGTLRESLLSHYELGFSS